MLFIFINFFLVDSRDAMLSDSVTNDSVDAILSMVPATLHKYLTPHSRNHSTSAAGELLLNNIH